MRTPLSALSAALLLSGCASSLPGAQGPEAQGGRSANTRAVGPDGASSTIDGPAVAGKYVGVSGIYPHLAAFNDGGNGGAGYGECGIGAVVPWAGSLWYMTYPPHERRGSADKLYQLDAELNLTVRAESVGGTHAGRMIHRESKQLVMGPYFIDEKGAVRSVDVKNLPARITAVTRHLTDPAGKVYYYDMEGPIWEVDVKTLAPKRVFAKTAPGWHGKGAWMGQGRLFISNNGESSAAGDLKGLTWELPETEWPKGAEDAGALAEYDGKSWKVVSRRQHTDITGPGDITGARSADDPVWAIGWDKRSVLLQTRDKNGWQTHRVLKGSYSYDPKHGWFTEWPRIRSIGGGRFMMNMHGTFFDFPATFRPGSTGGLKPLSTHVTYVGDFTEWKDGVVIAADDASVMKNPLAGKSQSNLRFIGRDALASEFGPSMGWGGVWVKDAVKAGVASDPLLVGGYAWRTLHLIAHTATGNVTVTVEIDEKGDGQFRPFRTVVVPAGGYVPYLLPAELTAPWLRLRTDRDATISAYVHADSPRVDRSAVFTALAPIDDAPAYSGGLLRPAPFSRDLQFVARTVDGDGKAGAEAYYEIDERLHFRRVTAAQKAAEVHTVADVKPDFETDAASVIVRGAGGKRWRLPKGAPGFDAASPLGPMRGVREITSERFTGHFHGTFYEMPRASDGTPEFARMKPLASHRARITDYASWRGMLVIAGVKSSGGGGHVFRAAAADGGQGLWFGAVDDLYKLGAPVGEGGPWRNTEVQAMAPSDPYLMAGYGKKTASLTHESAGTVTFTIQVDPLADGTWVTYARIPVPAGETVKHAFPAGYSAHWVRVQTDKATRATATFRYE